eukprot:gene8853-9031_t
MQLAIGATAVIWIPTCQLALAAQFQLQGRVAEKSQFVTRFLAAASSSFEALPLSSLSLSVVLDVFALPGLMLDAPEMARVTAKARAKLLELYGDLEKVWADEAQREQFLALPLPAVRCLLASEATAVASENTALVALAGWVEGGPAGKAATPAQRRDLLSLIRLPYLTSSYIGDILHSVPWIKDALDCRQLLNAFQFAVASETTRQRLSTYEYGPSALTPHFRCPRPLSSVTRASFEWSIELSTIKRMVADAKLWGRVVELSSPLHYFAGFWWQLLFNVEKTAAPADAAPDVAAAASATVVEFVGVRCHANCGSHDYWPRVVRFKASIAALQTGFWEMDYAYMKAIEGPIVDGVGLGYPGFFALPGQVATRANQKADICPPNTYSPGFSRLRACFKCQSGMTEPSSYNSTTLRISKTEVCGVPAGRYLSQNVVRDCPLGSFRSTWELAVDVSA